MTIVRTFKADHLSKTFIQNIQKFRFCCKTICNFPEAGRSRHVRNRSSGAPSMEPDVGSFHPSEYCLSHRAGNWDGVVSQSKGDKAMHSAVRVFIGLVVIAAIGTFKAHQAQKKPSVEKALINSTGTPIAVAVEKGAKWLASVQGADGGWGQDGGGETSNRAEERMESKGNDVA